MKVEALLDTRYGPGAIDGRAVWLLGCGRHARDWCDALQARAVSVAGFVDIARTDRPRDKRGLPVIGYDALPALRGDALVISALRDPTARQRVVQWCSARGWQSGREYLLGG